MLNAILLMFKQQHQSIEDHSVTWSTNNYYKLFEMCDKVWIPN